MRRIYPPFFLLFAFLIFCGNRAFAQCSVEAGNNLTICPGQSTTLTATVTGGAPTTYTWTSIPAGGLPSTASITITPAATTWYIIQVSGNGCNAIDSVKVTVASNPTAPVFTFSPNNACSGSSVVFSATAQAGVNFTWNFGDGTTGSGQSVSHVFTSYGNGTATFTVTLTATNASGCTSTSTQTVSIKQQPPAALAQGSGVDTVTLNGVINFYKCVNTLQQQSNYIFTNPNPNAGVTSTIIWGDTGASVTMSGSWTTISHIFGRGPFNMTYITTDGNGCPDTTHYIVFFGNNPAGGIASLGSTSVCGPDSLRFAINNWQSNAPGTIYTVTFNDGTPPLVFGQPPPDTIAHWFSITSCGTNSSNGTITFNNAFKATLTVQNPCGITAGAVVPIYVSFAPKASYTVAGGDTTCQNSGTTFVNTTTAGQEATNNGCTNNSPILWSVIPSTGWSIAAGTLGSDNGFTGVNYDPTSWTSGSNTLSLNFNNPGTYQVQIVSGNACGADTFIRTICVTIPPTPSFTLTPDSGCAPFVITATNTTPPIATCGNPTYTWFVVQDSFTCNPTSGNNYVFTGGTNANSTNANIQFNNQGYYGLYLIATNACGSYPAGPVEVKVKTVPFAAIAVPPVVCAEVTLDPDAATLPCAGTISSYAWTFQGGTPGTSTQADPGNVTFTTNGSHNITLAVTNECGTTIVTNAVIVDTLPIAIVGPPVQFCSGGSAQIGGTAVAGLTYLWTPANGLSAINISNPTVTLTNNGSTPITVTYYLTVTNANGCVGTDSVLVTVYPAATVNAGPPVTMCGGQTITLSGSFGGAATSVTWTSSNGGTFSNINSASTTYTPSITSGTVTLTLTTNDPAGPCPAVSATVLITINAPPEAVAGPDDSICSGSSVQIGSTTTAGYTYSWSPAVGLSAVNISNPIVTITNNGTTVVQQTYTLIVTALGCTDTDQVTVSVYPPATVNVSAPASICAGDSISLTGTIGGSATSATWSSPSGNFNPANALTTWFTPTIASGAAVATLTTNIPSAFCPAVTATVTITVKKVPVITNASNQIVCSGSPTSGVTFTSSTGGTTYTWTGSSPNGVTGFIPSGNTNSIPSQTLTNPGTTQGMVIYIITPTKAGCVGLSVRDTIFVNPLPNISAIPSQTICSGGSSTAVTPVSTTAGTTFTWVATSSGNLAGYTASGSGSIPGQTITNTGSVIDSIVYTITPTANGCPGPTTNFDIIVYPVPNVNLPAPQSICSGTSTTAVTMTSNVAGTTFSWIASGTAGITGFTTSGNGNIPAQTLTNSGTTAGTVTYIITPTANGCPGTPANYIITVKPIPVVTATPSPDTICNSTQTNIALASNVAGSTFSWTFSAPGSVTGAANGNGNTILQTLTNSSPNQQTVSYYITPTANGCPGKRDTVNVVVNPTVAIQFTPGNQTICSGQTTVLVNITSTTIGATFSWTSAANGIGGVIASGTITIPVQTLTNATNSALTAVYTVTAGFGICPSPATTYNITVNPTPHVILPAFQTICSGTATSAINLTSNVAGTTYTWTGSSPNGITGFAASGSSSSIPSQTLTDPNVTAGIVVYVITPTTNGCPGPAVNDTITVNPLPNINALTPQTICSGGTSTLVTLSSTTAGTTFTWTASNSGSISGYTAGGNGNIPAQTITNSGTNIDSVVFVITPRANGCNGPAIHFDIIIDPLPTVNLPAPQTICSGATSTLVTLTSATAGTTFSWTAAASAGITGFTASGTGNIPPQTISNSGNIQGSVTYTITPTANGCVGPNSNYVITINPVAVVTSAPDTICTGAQTNIALTSNVAGTTFNWTFNAPGSVTGAANGSGSAIQQVLSNSSTNPQTVSYFIVPRANGCNGKPDTVNVVVDPTITITLPANQAICSGQSTVVVTITSLSPGVAFSWTSAGNGITGVAASGTSTIPVQTLVNPGNSTLTAVYTITASYSICPSQTANYDITVDPTPHVILPAFQTICSGTATSAINLTSNVAGTTYTWTGSSPNGITGFAASGSSSSIPSQTLTDPNVTAGIVVYVITPTTNGCPGPAVNDTITVNPLPNINALTPQTICSGGTSTLVTLSSTTAGTIFTWIASNSGSISGYTAGGNGNIPAQTITNSGTNIDSVVFIITPRANGCNGPAIHFDIIVDPLPTVNLPAPQTICSGATSTLVTLTSATAGTTFSWTAAASAGITGFTASGTGNIPPQTISNSGNIQGSVTYTITPTANGCVGPNSNYVITINPVAIATATPSPDTICTGTQTNIALSSNVAGTTYTWTFSAPGSIAGAANGSGNAIQQVLSNSSASPQTVSYFIIPRANGCNGKPDTVNVVVGPNVSILLPPNQTICSGQSTVAVAITSLSAGVVFSWTSAANGIIGVAASGTDSILVQTLTNSGSSIVTVIFTITASYSTCPSQTANYDITVDPTPHVILPAFQTICSGTATSAINLTSNVAGTTYTWTGSSPNGITGFAASGSSSSIPSQTLTDPNVTAGIVVYVITPTTNGCPGPAVNDTITVNPLPNINALTPQTICSGGTSTLVTLSSTTAGTTFTWTASNSGSISGYTAGGNGNIPAQTITNSGTNIDSVVFVITPRANGCNGPAIHFDIIIDPLPTVNLPAPQTICSGATSTLVTLTSATAGTTFSWTAAASAGITGFTASGTGNIPPQTISNSGNIQGSVTYTITPTANGCVGPNSNYIITVKPIPVATSTPAIDTICPSTQTNITLTSNVAGTTFSWVATAPGSITGAANGNGNSIQQVLSNSSVNPQTVLYIITPTASGCPGLPDTATVVVHPGVTIQFSAPNQTICTGQTTVAVAITSPSPNVTFSWTSQANGIGGVVASGTNSIPSQVLTNNGNAGLTAIYTVTAGYPGCPSQTANYNILVNPAPHVILPPAQTICSGTATQNIAIGSNVAGTTFTWTGSSPDGVIGFIASGTTTNIPSQTLTNPATTIGMVIYSITPNAAGCPGLFVFDTITVNPLPIINPLTPQTICSAVTSAAVTLSSPTAGTTFSWTATSAGLVGYTPSGAGNIPAQTITNGGTAIDSVVFTINPATNGCNGPPVHYDIIVDPLPVVILPIPQSICSATATSMVILNSATTGTTYSWSSAATAGITGNTASGTGNIPAQTLFNAGNIAGTVTYTITPTANGCVGPTANYTVTIKPLPIGNSSPSPDTICPSTQVNITLTSNVAGTTFSWTYTEPASITGAANGTGALIQQVLSNNSVNPQTVLYIITPSASACPGPLDTAYVVVHPGVGIQFSAGPQTLCSGQTTNAVAVTSPSPNVIFQWTSQSNGVSGVVASGTDSIPAQTLINNGVVPLTVIYTATAGYPGCPNQTATYNITVDPTPAVILPPAQAICSGTGTQNIAIGSNVAGTTFTWTASSPNGVIGFTTSGNSSNIPAQTLTNTSAFPEIVAYAISPVSSGCPGVAVNDTITVYPLPVINPLPPQTICSGTSSAPVSLNSATAGTTYAWTAASARLTGFSTNGIGNIPSQIITNGGNNVDSVIFTITPAAAGCSGPNTTYVITVNPVPNVILPPNQVICGSQTTVAITLRSAVAGTTFSWTAVSSPNISGYTPAGTGNIPAQTITNSGNILGNVTYTITPTANSCPGIIANYIVSVKPLPVITALPSPDTICPSTQINITLTSSIPGTTITWVVNQPPAITGGTNGSGNSIQQILSNGSSSPQTVYYIIADSVNGCRGLPDTAIVDVLPGVALQLSAGPQTICSGQNTQVVVISSSSPGVTFSWVSQSNGVSGVAASGIDSIPVQVLVNNSNFGLTVDYYITAGYPGCPNSTTTYGIGVNPAPNVILPPFQTICSGTPSQVISLSSNVPGTSFTWAGSSPDGVTGFTPSGSSTIIPSQILTNLSTSNRIVVYIINPSSAGCPGIAVSDTITVKPLPSVNPIASQTICSGATSTLVNPSSTTAGTTYSWSVVYNGSISGFTPNGTGNIPAQALNNNGNAIDSVVFRIVPDANSCNGPAINFAIVVNPVPDVILPGSQNICSGTSSVIATLTSNVGGTTFSWTATASPGISGFTTNGTGDIPAQTLIDSNNISGTVIYNIMPVANGCPGIPANYVMTVKLLPVASATPAIDTICPSAQTNITITANIAGTTFNWTAIAPGSVTGASNGAGNSILQTLNNSSQNPQTVLYIIIPKANGCIGSPDSVSVVVHPEITIQFSTGPQTICSGQTTLAVAITSPSPGVVFSWTSQSIGVSGVIASGTDSIPAQTLVNATNSSLAVTYNVTAGYGACSNTPATYEVTVNPNPAVILPPAQTVCSGTASQSIAIGSSVAGTTFTWTGASPNGITGFTASGNTSIIPSQLLTNPGISAGIVIFSITPSSTGCPGIVVNDTITVNPLPIINPLTPQTICSGGTSSLVNVTSVTAGTAFNWNVTYSGNQTGFTNSGNGNIPAQTISNTGSVSDSVVYTIVPTASGCNGPAVNYDIIVNPTPDVILPSPQSICSGTTTSIAPLSSNVTGTTFSWTATATVGITGFTISGTGDIPAQTLSNSGNTFGTVTYSVTPVTAGCPGPVATYIITVKPLPVVNATPSIDTICPSTQTNIVLSYNVAGTTFSWTAAAPANITGASNGTGNSIQQVLSNNGQTPLTVLYTITPVANACFGPPATVSVTVNPAVNIQYTPANQTICSGQNTQVVSITSTSPGVSFSWTSQANGVTGVALSGTNSIPVQTLLNSTNSALTVNYNVTAGYNNCPGFISTYSIVVNPNPAIILPPRQTVCSGIATQSIPINSNVIGTTFTWTGTSPNGVTGFTASGNTSVIPSQILTNAGISTGIVVFAITPSSTGCPGVAVNDTITVNPLPVINPLTPQTICSGATSTLINLSSATNGTTFNWNVTYSGNQTGFTTNGNGNIPAQTLTNTGTVTDSVVYTIIPTASGCNGLAVNYNIIVNPTPDIILPSPQSICSGATTSVAPLTSHVTGTTFSWTATAIGGVTGFTISGTGDIPGQTLINPGNAAGSVTYVITPVANTCPGLPSNYTIAVKPLPVASATPAIDTICPSAQTNILISSPVAGTTFSWTANAPGTITGSAPGTGNTIQQVLSNTGQTPQTVMYIITPAASGCVGAPDTVNVVVNPGVTIQFSPTTQTICSGQNTQVVSITSASPGVSFSWISQANGVTGVAVSGTDSIQVQNLVNGSNSALTVNYNVTAGYGGCPPYLSTYSIVVNPNPAVILPPTQTVCSGTSSQSIPIGSNIAGTTFVWSGASPNGIIGFTPNGNTSVIPSQFLTNSGISAGIVIFSITPSSTGCPGVAVYDTITVNPLPVVNPLIPQTICSGGTSVLVNLSSATAGTSFNWSVTYSGNETGFTGSGNGNIPAQIITNTGSFIDSVVYTIIPSASGCNGPAVNYDIIVNPTLDIILPSPQSICSGATTSVAPLTSHVAGTTFSWTASATAGVTGFTASGTGDIPAQTLINPGNTVGLVTYVITPVANTCPGLSSNYTITVKPLPVASATPAIDTICPSAQTNIVISSNVAGTNFSWTTTAPGTITGSANGTGSTIQQVLSNTGQTPQTVMYIITPAASGCVGRPDTVNVLVNPGVTIQFSPTTQTICSGQNTQTVLITSTSPGVAFSWTSQANGVIGVAVSGTDSIPVQILVNNSNAALTVGYTVTASYAGCPGYNSNYSIVVNPTPNVILPPAQTICSGAATQIIQLNSNVAGTTYAWVGSSPNGVTGFTTSGTSSNIPSQTIRNAAATAGIVVYAVTPSSSGCPGTVVNDTITVNPLPVVNPLSPQTICSAASSTIVNLSSATVGTAFSWTVGYSGNNTGFTPAGAGNIPAQTITNNGSTIDSVVFTISPSASGCNGSSVNYDIIVDPTPNVILPAPQSICSGGTTLPVNLSSAVAGATFSWTATATAGITGYTQNGTGNIPAQTLLNPGNVSNFVTYVVTATANSCPGQPSNYLVTVKPLPVATATPSPDTICTATQTNITITSTVVGTSFSWTASAAAGISGASNGTGTLIQQILSNSGLSPQVVTYVITPIASTCPGPLDTLNVVVNPGAPIQFTPTDQSICSGQPTQLVTISSLASGATFSWTVQANGITGVIASGTNTIPVQTLTNSNSATDTVVYTVTSVYFSCPGQTAIYNIAVKPIPQDVLPPNQIVCSGTPSTSVVLSSTVRNTTFVWAGSSNNGISGFIPSGTLSTIPPQTLINPADTAGTVVFSITPTADGCTGPPSNYVITVSPLPNVVLPPAQIICNGAPTNAVTLTSNVSGTTFNWTSSASPTLSGNIPSGLGTIPSQVLNNSGTQQDTATFVITPTAAGCAGQAANCYMIVNPTPVVIFTPAPQTLCSGQTSHPVSITSATPGVNIVWTAVVPVGITGADTAGLNIIPAQTLFNTLSDTFPRPLNVIYNAQVATSGVVCPGTPGVYSITVEPVPVIGFNQSVNNGCSPLTVDFFPNSMNYGVPDTLVFNWGDGSPNTTLYPSAVSPMWYPVNHTFYNDSIIPLTFTIRLTARNGCIDTSAVRTITILPNRISAFFTAQPTTGCEPLVVTLHDFSTGPGTLIWCFDYNLQTDSCMGASEVDTAGSIVNYTFGAGIHTVALHVTNGFGCAHDSAYQTITVTPAPVASFTFINDPCAITPVSFTEHSTVPAGSSIAAYSWNFGDNSTSMFGNPVHTYDTAGVYTACLTVISSYGCTDSICQPVTVLNKPHVDFTNIDTCLNKQPTPFARSSAGATTYSWDFGDGTLPLWPTLRTTT